MNDLDFSDLDEELSGSLAPVPVDGMPIDPGLLETDPAVYAARETRDKDVALANLAQGVTDIGASLASQGRVRANPAVFDAARKEAQVTADEAAKDVTGRRKTVSDFIKAKLSGDRAKATDDYRNRHLEMMADQNAAIRGERKEKQLQDKTEDAGKALAPLQDLNQSVQAVDAALGAPVDTLVVKNGELYQPDGKTKLDLPGASLPGVGRVSFYSGPARTLQGAIAGVFNRELKDRAGSTVTNPEMERLRTEWGNGMFNTEAEMVGALQRFKMLAQQELKNREASYSPDVIERYRSQGGKTSQDFATKQTKTVNGVTYEKVPGGWKPI